MLGDIVNSLGSGFSSFGNGLGNALYPTDPSTAGYIDPATTQAARNNSLISLGLGIMAAPYDMRGLGHGLLSAYQGSQGDYTGAMQNAFRNTLIKRELDQQTVDRDFQQKERALQLKQQERADREQAAQTAQRVAGGMSSATDPSAYWNLVSNSPEVKDMLSTLGMQAPYTGPLADPNSLKSFQDQLSTAAGVSSPPIKPMVLPQGASVIGVTPTGNASTLVQGQPEVSYQDLGDRKVPVDKFGNVVSTLPTLKKGLPPGLGADPNSVEQTAQMIANGQIPMISGFALKTPWGQEVVARVGQLNPNYSAQNYTTGQQTLTAFSKGKQGDTVRSLNVAVQHLDTLGELADALNNGNIPLINKAANAWKTQTGQAAPTSFEAAKQIVADEVVKAVVGSGGAQSDREEAARTVNAASSPAQLKQVIATYQQLMGGQLSGLKQQYEQGTGRQDFERFLAPETKSKLKTKTQSTTTLSDTDLLKKWGGQ